jgi:hypothetical protein
MGSEDQFRHYFPLMRRIIILVAVLTAIPVIMWTITVFVRGYFGPPKIAGPRPLATAAIETPVTPAASQDANAPPVVEARATVTDARTIPPAVKWPSSGDRQGSNDAGPPSSAPSAAVTGPAGSAGTDQRATQAPGPQMMAAAPAMPTGTVMQTGAADTSGALAGQESADTDQQQTADTALAAAQPIAGPVPLPRHRPRSFAMLTSAVPMPRPRPETAGAAGSEGNATPLGWLQKIFTPQQQ